MKIHIFELRRSYNWSSQLWNNLSSCEIKAWKKKSGMNGIQTHDLYDTSAVLYQLSYQANWEVATLWVRNKPVQDEDYEWIYQGSYIWTQRMIWKFVLRTHNVPAPS